MNLKPLDDRIIIKQSDAEDKSAGGPAGKARDRFLRRGFNTEAVTTTFLKATSAFSTLYE